MAEMKQLNMSQTRKNSSQFRELHAALIRVNIFKENAPDARSTVPAISVRIQCSGTVVGNVNFHHSTG